MGAAGININDVVFEQCEHDFETTTTATCTQAGVTTNTCKLCGKTETEETPAGHEFDNSSDMNCNDCNITFLSYSFVASTFDNSMGTTTATDSHVVIPETFECNGKYYKTTSIGQSAFKDCNNLISIVIPASVTSIKNAAFWYCKNLESVTFATNSNLTSMSTNVFNSCSKLKEIIIPDGVTKIDNDSFSKCTSLTNITIPTSVKSIGTQAFYNNKSMNITYLGTIAQWNAVSKGVSSGGSWNSWCEGITVTCTDGTVYEQDS